MDENPYRAPKEPWAAMAGRRRSWTPLLAVGAFFVFTVVATIYHLSH